MVIGGRDVEKHLQRGIKDVIAEFPRVGEILAAYDIGCTTCMVGTCLLGDVVEIHNLPRETEKELMEKIAQVIDPSGSPVDIKPRPEAPKVTSFCPPIRELMEEHRVIEEWLALIPQVTEALAAGNPSAWDWISAGLQFSREYADRYHHAKEENILFDYGTGKQAIVDAMCLEHNMGREHIQGASTAVIKKDVAGAIRHLTAYRELLEAHIQKEDEILYPWIQSELSTHQVGELYARCESVKEELDPARYEEHKAFVQALAEKLNKGNG
jgi:hemerythrin-like domain-containing protein